MPRQPGGWAHKWCILRYRCFSRPVQGIQARTASTIFESLFGITLVLALPILTLEAIASLQVLAVVLRPGAVGEFFSVGPAPAARLAVVIVISSTFVI